MSIITRAKNILITPAVEWRVISSETETPATLLRKYVLPLAMIPALAHLLMGFLSNPGGMAAGIYWRLSISMAISMLLTSILSFYICTYVVDGLAPNFDSPKDLGRSAQLVAYSSTAFWVANIFTAIPGLRWLGILGLYGFYLFYLGLPVMKKTPQEKQIGYIVLSALVILVVSYAVDYVIGVLYVNLSGNFFTPRIPTGI